MPPVRRTPGRFTSSFAAYAPENIDRASEPAVLSSSRTFQEPEIDHGFNPAWALAPKAASSPAPTPAFSFTPRTAVFNLTPKPTTPEAISSKPGNAITPPPCKVESVSKENDIDAVQLAVMAPLVMLWGFKTAVCTAGASLWDGLLHAKDRFRNGIAPEPVKKSRSNRYDPMSRNARRTPKKKGEESMLSLPPHMVGATPNVVRQARGEKLRGQTGPKTPSAEEAKRWKLFHATPMAKQPRAAQFETPSKGGSNDETPATPYPSTPGTVVPSSAYGHEKRRKAKSIEFSRNIQRQQFNEWISVLHHYGIRVSKLRPQLLKQFKFPTSSIYAMMKADDESLQVLAKCLTDPSFTSTHRLVMPSITYPEPKEFKKASSAISLESYVQQADGCCKACRGFSWAGKVETRTITPGTRVPVKSKHKSIVPYTTEEEEEFQKGRYEMLYRRWCQESRYDWLFEEPDLSKKDKKGRYEWTIPGDDPRLRHTAINSLQRRMDKNGTKLYTTDAYEHRQKMIRDLTKQDIAAHVLIKAIKKENPEVAKLYQEANLERQRRQVSDQMCVRQVKVVFEKPSQLDKPKQLKPVASIEAPSQGSLQLPPPTQFTQLAVVPKPSLFSNPPQLLPTVHSLAPTALERPHQPVFEFSPAKKPTYTSSAPTAKKRSMDNPIDEVEDDEIVANVNKKQKRFRFDLASDHNGDLAPTVETFQTIRPSKRVKFSSTHQGPTVPQNLASPTKSILKSRVPGAVRADLFSPISKKVGVEFGSSLSSLPSVGSRPTPLAKSNNNGNFYKTTQPFNDSLFGNPNIDFTFNGGPGQQVHPENEQRKPQLKPFKFELPAAFNPKIIDQYEKGVDDSQIFWDRIGQEDKGFDPRASVFGGSAKVQPPVMLFGGQPDASTQGMQPS